MDPNSLDKIRHQRVIKPTLIQPLDSIGITREGMIPGLREKFNDIVRSTPNPMASLLGTTSVTPSTMMGNSISTSNHMNSMFLSTLLILNVWLWLWF